MNSKAKGKRGELEVVRMLNKHGFAARRGQQFSGGPDSPDVICPSLDFHWEVKLTNHLNLTAAWRQCVADTTDQVPIVAHKANRQEWKVTLRLEDLLQLLKRKETELPI